MCSSRRIAHTSKVLVFSTSLLQSVWYYSFRCCGALQGRHNVHTSYVTIVHKVQKCKCYRQTNRHVRTHEQHGDNKSIYCVLFYIQKGIHYPLILPYCLCVSVGFICRTNWPIVTIRKGCHTFDGTLGSNFLLLVAPIWWIDEFAKLLQRKP
jgi:hypothetical protein